MAGCVEWLTCRSFRAIFAARFHKRPTCESSALHLVRVYFGFSRGLSLGLVGTICVSVRVSSVPPPIACRLHFCFHHPPPTNHCPRRASRLLSYV